MTKLSRRQFLKSSFIAVLSLSSLNCHAFFSKKIKIQNLITPKLTDTLEVPDNYQQQIIASWGDNLFNNNNYDFDNPNLEISKQCYGYNNDFCIYMPIKGSSENGLLCVNHEYTLPELMFPKSFLKHNYKEALEICLESIGHSVFEIRKRNGNWQIERNSPYNRRITATNTICEIRGYAKGDQRLRTKDDHTASKVYGTIANCSGCKTPWGTIVIGEENFNMTFGGKNSQELEKKSLKSYKVKKHAQYNLNKYFERFDIGKNPREVNKFGFLVEIDPFSPDKPPVKRTSLGRFFHEGAAVIIDDSGYAVVYSGDDKTFEHLYKFVSSKKYNSENPDPNILDEGILYVAKFYENNSLKWVPLIHGRNGLDETNGFNSQADICIDTRLAAKQVSATKLDRPEGIAINPKTGRVYIALTNNYKRLRKDIVSREAPNFHGYILELHNHKNHAKDSAYWKIILNAADTELSNPDNLAFDSKGNLYVATDGMERSRKISDSIYKINLEDHSISRMLNTPSGSEICGPAFTPDEKTLFACIQHPGAKSSFKNPNTRWPKFQNNIPPLPSIIAMSKG